MTVLTDKEQGWYAMKVWHLRSGKVATMLPADLGEWFVPPRIANLLFVRSTLQQLSDYRQFNAVGSHLSFMKDRMTGGPVIVKDGDMQTFMRICSAVDYPIVMTEAPTVKLGDFVRVKDGPLKGLEGNVVRIRKSRRILVNLSDVVWVATEFISPDYLEVIEPEPALNL